MTDPLDAPEARETDAAPDETVGAAPSAPASEVRRDNRPSDARWLLATCLAGAGAIHVAMAPSHLGESAVEGWGFVLAAWLQFLLAGAVLLRPSRRVNLAVVVSGAAFIAVWAVSRIAGLPFGAHSGHAESVTIVDGVCVALEAVALLVAGGMLLPARAQRPVPAEASSKESDGTAPAARVAGGLRSPLAIAGVIGAIALTTAAVVSPSARDHAAGSHGDHAHADGTSMEGMVGMAHDHPATADDKGFAALSNGHQHEHGQDEPLTAAERQTLATQLAATADLVQKYPTIADAEAAGWHRAGPFSPGLGTHYQSPKYVVNTDGDMDPEDLAAPMLVFDGLAPDSPLAGFMFLSYGTDSEPTGFAGPNDHWHYHESVCIKRGADGNIETPFGADLDGVTKAMCTDIGGTWIDNTGYMVHVWNVPGYESPDGMFTELNPKITCPDGTYHRIDIKDVGSKNTVCLDP